MTQIKLRRDTLANFTSSNPVLGQGEPAYETDTKKLKIGDGSTAYTQLAYFSSEGGSGTDISASLPLKITDGVISLEVDGQTIQIVDGKLHANTDELGNEVNDLSGRVTAVEADITTIQNDITDLSGELDQKQNKLTAGDNITISDDNVISASGGSTPDNMVTTNTRQDILEYKTFKSVGFNNTDSSPKTTVAINTSSPEIQIRYNGDTSDANASRIRDNSDNFFIGTNKKGTVIGSSIPLIRQGSGPTFSSSTILDSSNLGDFVDGTTVTYTNNKLSAAGGSSTPDNMVTTDTSQTITGAKTFKNNIILNQEAVESGIRCQYYGNDGNLRISTFIQPSNLSLGEGYASLIIGLSGVPLTFNCSSVDMTGNLTTDGEINLTGAKTGQNNKLRISYLNGSETATISSSIISVYTDSDTYTSTVNIGVSSIPLKINASSVVDKNNNLFLKTKSLTQSEYDALTTKDASILYVITD